MIFEFAKQSIARGGIGTIDRDALLGIRRGGWCGAKVRAGEPAEARQDFPCELVDQVLFPWLRQGTASAVPFHDALFRGFNP